MSQFESTALRHAAVSLADRKQATAPLQIAATDLERGADEIVGVLRQVEALNALPYVVLADLAHATRVEEFEQGSTVYRMGEPNHSFCVVASGRVMVSCFSAGGRMLLRVIGQYGVFGDLLLGREMQGCQVHAHIDTRLCSVPEPDFLKTCLLHPELAIAFARIVARKLKETCQDVEDVIFLTARQRVLKLLARLANEAKGSSCMLANPLLQFSQDELAHLVGITRECINGILRQLERSGIIQKGHRAVRVHRDKLEQVLIEEALVADERA